MTGLYCPVNNLPREILSKILNFLLHSDKKICRSVCHYWLQVKEVIHAKISALKKVIKLLLALNGALEISKSSLNIYFSNVHLFMVII